jgi:pantothenate kinase
MMTDIAALVGEIAARSSGRDRFVVAVAGAPGSGKSTLAEQLVVQLNAEGHGPAEVLPMDGYHLDNTVLDARGWRAVKGAPQTFDAAGFAVMLKRIRDAHAPVVVPVFDRSIDIARAGARVIGTDVRIVVVEGNYLLLDDPAWSVNRACFDLSLFLDVPVAILEERLIERWLTYGLSRDAAEARARGNDLTNGRLVASRSVDADFRITMDEGSDTI